MMLRHPCAAAVLASVAALAATGAAQANQTITFDDLTTDPFAMVPSGHAGLDWSGFSVISRAQVPGSGYDNGTVSGSYSAFNVLGQPASFASLDDSTFDVVGAYLTAAWNDDLTVTAQAFRGGALVDSATILLDTSEATWVELAFEDVDEVVFTSTGGIPAGLGNQGTHFSMDDLTVSAVPAPGAGLALLLAGVAGPRRRRR